MCVCVCVCVCVLCVCVCVCVCVFVRKEGREREFMLPACLNLWFSVCYSYSTTFFDCPIGLLCKRLFKMLAFVLM